MSVALRYFWTISTNFLLLFLPARHKLKSSQRSNIGRADVILNNKITSEKKNATSREQRLLIGNGGKNYRCQPLTETELRKFREFLFQPVGTEKLEYLAPPEVRPFVLKIFLWNRAFNLHLNRSNWKFCLNGKRPSIIGITGCPPEFGPQNSSWESNTIFISLITSIDTV